MSLNLDTPIQFVRGVGPARAVFLAKLGVHTVKDFLKTAPMRYEDRRNLTRIKNVRSNQTVTLKGAVAVKGTYKTPVKKTRIFEVVLVDDTGKITLKFFNQAYLDESLKKGDELIVYGSSQLDEYSQAVTLYNPDFERSDGPDAQWHMGRIVPVYRRLGQLKSRTIRSLMGRVLEGLGENPPDLLPAEIREKYQFPGLAQALSQIHFPSAPQGDSSPLIKDLSRRSTPSFKRLIFEEFFAFQVGLGLFRKERKQVPKERRIELGSPAREAVRSILPFRPTRAQKRVLREIVEDLSSPHVMMRLLQGDVGSGKTIVALQAVVVVLQNGYQAALMVPTEILAEQHYKTILKLFQGTPFSAQLLTARIKGRRRREILDEVGSGKVNLLIGTHALIQDKVTFSKLGLVVVDEQHRFGVAQRTKLLEKGDRPDLLVMTATPIPRSLALTVYGDLNLSLLDELPPGRKPVRTLLKNDRDRAEVYALIRREIERGRQAYVVYPLVENSEKLNLKAATEMSEHWKKVFADRQVGLLHGRTDPEEKEAMIEGFKNGSIQILVATTVIEVGIDIPNATVMVVEHSERFGLSQLHQLRGRVGRGSSGGLCIFMASFQATQEARQRLKVLESTNDGFKVSEYDLEFRGPGEFLGTQQSGVPEFWMANLVRDRQLLELARREAENYLLKAAERDLKDLVRRWKQEYSFFEAG